MSDGTKPVLVMMVGLPASGKSTISNNLAKEINATVFSSDTLREELYGDVNDQEHNNELFAELHRRIKRCLSDGKSAIYDACNISSKKRRSFLQEIEYITCEKECVITATPYEKCLENNKNRDRQVPERVIERMYRSWNTPYYFEGFDSIKIHYWDAENMRRSRTYALAWYLDYLDYEQNNPHHNLSLGGHCEKAMYYLLKGYRVKWSNDLFAGTIINAAAIHDCGKLFTKTFKNGKGKVTDVAHYYSHEHVGAYDSLFFQYVADINALDVSILVDLHMKPYVWERDGNEKLRKKYLKLWGDELYQGVMLLHEADKAAH